ncbi:hypothetical protein BpHYR1_047806, partial [Brachionus plicatilis]
MFMLIFPIVSLRLDNNFYVCDTPNYDNVANIPNMEILIKQNLAIDGHGYECNGNCEFDENPIENFKWLSTVLTTGYYCRLQKTKIIYKNKIFNEICNADNLECNLGDSILIWNREIVNSCPYRLFSSLKLNLPYDNIFSNPSGNQMFK